MRASFDQPSLEARDLISIGDVIKVKGPSVPVYFENSMFVVSGINADSMDIIEVEPWEVGEKS